MKKDAIEAKEKNVTLFNAVVGLYHAVHELAVQTNFHPAVDKRLREVGTILIYLERTPAPQAPAKADHVAVVGEDEAVAIVAHEVYGVGPHAITGNCIRAMRKAYRSGDANGYQRGLSTPIDGFHRDGCTCEGCHEELKKINARWQAQQKPADEDGHDAAIREGADAKGGQ